ncbi:hypothetical protein [Kribbella shirazensis]|uniref:Uncharacterized protein n=1 Tax=Kribbella shirazensis TaxID=1105143 RepID=A0A7X5V8L5_9ACTN|nr:hypothetical protein [Kribbella shirazensis]NIK56577.1 hypothetical protein [Kribbella shirazensis]
MHDPGTPRVNAAEARSAVDASDEHARPEVSDQTDEAVEADEYEPL